MKEYVDRDWGLETLNHEELLTSGGLTWQELRFIVQKMIEVAKTVEKYWPSFRKGFQVGWEGG